MPTLSDVSSSRIPTNATAGQILRDRPAGTDTLAHLHEIHHEPTLVIGALIEHGEPCTHSFRMFSLFSSHDRFVGTHTRAK